MSPTHATCLKHHHQYYESSEQILMQEYSPSRARINPSAKQQLEASILQQTVARYLIKHDLPWKRPVI